MQTTDGEINKSKGVKPSCSMMENYLNTHIMAPTLICFSKELLSLSLCKFDFKWDINEIKL